MIYLDHNATTPVLPEVLEAMLPWLSSQWGNPSSVHAPGRAARRAVEDARAKVAAGIGAKSEQVIFTSGATEANNAAIHSALIQQPGKRHIITSTVEHSAVLAYCDYLERHQGVEVTRLPVNPEGKLAAEQLLRAIRPDTALVSLMWANNETGVIWPITDFAQICAAKGVPFHTDAVQAAGKIPVHFAESGASFLSLSGHKFGAPKGIGALLAANPDVFVPFHHGGKQENGHRGGTESVPMIVAFGAAADLALAAGFARWDGVAKLRKGFETGVLASFLESSVHAYQTPRLPNTSNLHFPGHDGDAIVTYLDRKGICVSSGSACLESAITPSHVLLAMTGSHERASESVRISLGVDTSPEDLAVLMQALGEFFEMNG